MTTNKEQVREPGFYWVKLAKNLKWVKKAREWVVALWIGDSWLLLGNEYWDDDFLEIEERRLDAPKKEVTDDNK